MKGQHSLSSLEISLEDEKGNILRLADGQPTIIHLKFCRMARGLEQTRFHMNVSSEDDERSHPGNTPSSFAISFAAIQFPQPDKWAVALDTITLPLEFHQLTSPPMEWFIRESCLNLAKTSTTIRDLPFAYVHFGSTKEMVRLVRAVLQWGEGDGNRRFYPKLGKAGNLEMWADPEFAPHGGTLNFHRQLGLLLGMRTTKTIEKRLVINVPPPPQCYHFKNDPDYSLFLPHNIVVYASCVSPSTFGSGRYKVLKLVHLPHQDLSDMYSHYTTFESKRLDWKSLTDRKSVV
jgi:hypothetical protein